MRKNLFFSAFILFSVVLNAQNWTLQNTNMSGSSIAADQISVVDSNIVWINGFNGSGTGTKAKVFAHTQNGGTTWQAGNYNGFGATVFPQVITGVTYNKAFAIAMDTVVGGLASFWKTTDGGANWSLVSGVMNNGAATFADGVMFWNSDKGFCYGDPVSHKFDIYYTADGGTTWNPTLVANLTAPLAGEYGINEYDHTSKIEGGYAAFITNKGRVYKTSNYGINWDTIPSPFPPTMTGVKIFMTGINKMIVSGIGTSDPDYTWKQTINGGTTWTTYTPPTNNYAMTYVPYSNSMMISTSVVVGSGGVSYSNNGGTTWTKFIDALLPTTDIQCLGVGFADVNHGWVGCYNITNPNVNSILKYKYIGGVGINNTNLTVNNLDIYPNPSNGIVNFTIPANNNNSVANLSIVDITGKTIFEKAIHFNDITKTSFDFSNYSKGIYFAKYTSNNQTTVKKLIIN